MGRAEIDQIGQTHGASPSLVLRASRFAIPSSARARELSSACANPQSACPASKSAAVKSADRIFLETV